MSYIAGKIIKWGVIAALLYAAYVWAAGGL